MPLNLSETDQKGKRPLGKLYVVATPIGNIDDITLRGIKVLQKVDFVAAEDTRKTGILLAHHDIESKMISYHEYNERTKAQSLAGKIEQGILIALVTDAGTPTVSDPGYRLVRACVEKGIDVIPIPGVSAAAAAISVSGLPTDRFVFLGFLPKKKGKRLDQIRALCDERGTMIFYESPKRIARLLEELQDIFGDREGVIGREMTKTHEEFMRGKISCLRENLEKRDGIKGEITLLISGDRQEEAVSIENIRKEIKNRLEAKTSRPSEMAAEMAAKYGLPRKLIYNEIMKIRWRLFP